MAIVSSGIISISDLRAEFGGSAPDTISEYYRGAGLVPDTPANAGIPTSGAISLSDFYGGDASVTTVEFNADSYTSSGVSSSVTTASISVNSNGTISGSGNIASASGTWTPSAPSTGFGNDYEIRATLISGVSPTGTLNSWLALSLNRTWGLTDSVSDGNAEECTLLIEIRDAATSTVQDTATFSISAERF